MSEFRRSHKVLAALLAAAFASMTACQDGAVTPRTVKPPVDPMTNLGTYMVDVDLKTGKISSYQVDMGGAPATAHGLDASIIGGTGTITHKFTLVGNAPTTGNTFTLQDRIENKEAFRIGTPKLAPNSATEDTMGVYVFIVYPPTVIAGCTPGVGCTVTADSADGAYTFTGATPQKYMYFKTILEASDGVSLRGKDYTDQSPANGGTGIDYFRALAFHTIGTVTNFKFGVSVSTALAKPNAIRWKVSYVGDSLPNRIGTTLNDLRSEPDWRKGNSPTSVVDTSIISTGCPGGGTSNCLRISSATPASGTPDDSLFYYRSDSLNTTDSAYVAASVTVTGNGPNDPSVFIGMQDRVHLILFGIASNKAGFTDATGAFLTTGASNNSNVVNSYRLAKFGTDSVAVFVNGAELQGHAYATLPAAPAASTPNRYFWFGNRVKFSSSPKPSGDISLWTNVTYEIGATIP